MNGIYWALTAADLAGRLADFNLAHITDFVLQQVAPFSPSLLLRGSEGPCRGRRMAASGLPPATTPTSSTPSAPSKSLCIYPWEAGWETGWRQVLVLTKQLGTVDGDKVADFIASLQQPDGSFVGDKWGEVRTEDYNWQMRMEDG